MLVIVGRSDAAGRNNALADISIGRLKIYAIMLYYNGSLTKQAFIIREFITCWSTSEKGIHGWDIS
jgi:hypothetical protein